MRMNFEGDTRNTRADRCNTTIERLYELESKKKEKIAVMQFKRYQQEISTLRQKPAISLNSKIIVEGRQKVPLFERS